MRGFKIRASSGRLGAFCLAVALSASPILAADISGAGATFPYPVYAKWADAYHKETGVGLNYQSIGSGGGIKQIKAKTVDFGASDMPLKDDELSADGLLQFPTVMGGVVPVVNVSGVKPGELKLTGALVADIYMAKITKWNDPAIKALNPSINLPDAQIATVHRADASGTSFIVTNYLSKVSPDWKTKIGEGTSVNWPSGGAAGKGNEGVSTYVQRLPNSIGYVEYAYAKQNKMTYVSLKNQAGSFVEPTVEAFKAAAAGADWSKTFYQVLTDEPGKDSWPITGATFILMHTAQDKPAQATAVLKFFDWSYANGDKAAGELDYVPLPDSLKAAIHKAWDASIKDTAGKAIASK